MRGRMPYPIPFLPMIIVAILMSDTFSSLMNLCGSREKAHGIHVPSLPKNATNQDFPSVDPFGDVADVSALTPRVRITTKFVEIYSGTEELSFNWLVPFEQSTPKE